MSERERPWRDRDLLERLYWDEWMSTRDIAEEFECDSKTVLNWLNRHGIETRGVGSPGLTGSDNPFWKGGHERYYGPSWYSARKEARERDNRVCRVCRDVKGTEVHVHHIKPARTWDVDEEHEEMNSLVNLICICRYCHYKLEGKFQNYNHEEFERKARSELNFEQTNERNTLFCY